MAVSAAALPALNAKLFEEEVGTKHCRFVYFCDSLRTLAEAQVQPQEREVIRAVVSRHSQRVAADLERVKERFYATAIAEGSRQAYREKVAVCAHRRSVGLNAIVVVYKRCIQQIANELMPQLRSERAVQDLFARANAMVHTNFNC